MAEKRSGLFGMRILFGFTFIFFAVLRYKVCRGRPELLEDIVRASGSVRASGYSLKCVFSVATFARAASNDSLSFVLRLCFSS